MNIMTLKQLAKKIELESLFVPGGTISAKEVERLLTIDTIRYDMGKYAKANIGRDIQATPKPVWYVSRGDHITIMTYHIAHYFADVTQTAEEKVAIDRVTEIWNHMNKKAA